MPVLNRSSNNLDLQTRLHLLHSMDSTGDRCLCKDTHQDNPCPKPLVSSVWLVANRLTNLSCFAAANGCRGILQFWGKPVICQVISQNAFPTNTCFFLVAPS